MVFAHLKNVGITNNDEPDFEKNHPTHEQD